MDLITLAMAKAYTDKKAGYSEVKKNILLPMTTLPAGKSAHEAETENDFLVGYEGQVYIVLFDGVKYNCEVGEVTGSVIGVKTDLFMVMAGRGYVDITVTDQTIDHTIEIYQETETIHPIDQKYLGDYEKKMLYDGSPTKMDLSAAGMGYAYLLSGDNLFALARGQNVHFEYTLANGTKAEGVLDNYDYMKALAVPMVYGAFTLLFSSDLGGTGVSFNYADIGEIANLKLWTEYSENKPYYVTGYADGTNRVFFPTDQNKVMAAIRESRLAVRYRDNGGNMERHTPARVVDYRDSAIVYLYNVDANTLKSIEIRDGQPTEM